MYIGRFAPSPTGPLHFGSLVAALASFLDARAHRGNWLIRIEDLDTPRCQPQAPKLILDALTAHGLVADGEILYQSTRVNAYRETVSHLLQQKQAYFCQCTRKDIRARGGIHDSNCRLLNNTSGAVRFYNANPPTVFEDRWLGSIEIRDAHALEDFTLLRKDGLFAYNLAVVVDDTSQSVSHIVRGEDLLSTTSAHLSLYRYLGVSAPDYMHIPLVNDSNGRKLSKQNHAPALDSQKVADNLIAACKVLEIAIPKDVDTLDIDKIIAFAVETWHQRWASSKLAHPS